MRGLLTSPISPVLPLPFSLVKEWQRAGTEWMETRTLLPDTELYTIVQLEWKPHAFVLRANRTVLCHSEISLCIHIVHVGNTCVLKCFIATACMLQHFSPRMKRYSTWLRAHLALLVLDRCYCKNQDRQEFKCVVLCELLSPMFIWHKKTFNLQ